MRKLFYFISIAFALQACEAPDELAEAKKELEGLKSEKKEIEAKIKELDDKIAVLDTTVEEVVQTLVTVVNPVNEPFIYKIQVPGVADSRQNIVVSAEAMGNVTNILVHEGNMVKKGQTLATIDSDVMRTQIAELETRLDFAAEMYEKQKRLWEKKIGSEVQYLQAKNNKESLEQSIKSLKAQASKSKITAPISGYLDEMFLRKGQTINMGMPAVRIVDLNTIRLSADVSEKYIGQFSTNDSVTIKFPSLNKKFRTKIVSIGQVVSADNRTFTIEAELENKDNSIKPNVLADVTIPVYINNNATTVPTSIIQQGKKSDFVFVAIEGSKGLEAKKQAIKAGRSFNGKTEVLEGLSPNQKVVDLGGRNVADGEPLRLQ
ncbi:MAG: efflux RND transporter periplasmic adaptor subunit [Bacteroidia bacterium]